MRRTIGAEFPQRRTVSLKRAIAREHGKLARSDVSGVVVAEDVAGDEVEEGLLVEELDPDTQARREFGLESQSESTRYGRARLPPSRTFRRTRFGRSIALPIELGVDFRKLCRESANAFRQRQFQPLPVPRCTQRDLQDESVELNPLLHEDFVAPSGSMLFFGSFQFTFFAGSRPKMNFSMLV
jgi:hypothetical protein